MSNVPEIRFKGFTDAWEQRKLGEVCGNFRSGNSITADSIFDVGVYPVYGGNGLRGYTNDFTHEGDFVLVGRQGALCGNINTATGKVYISEHAVVINENELSDIGYLEHLLTKLQLNRFSESSAQPGLSVDKLKKIDTASPTKVEQTAIGSFFRTLDNTIAIYKRKLDGLRELKKAYLQQMFPQEGEVVPRIRFAGFTGDWENRNLGSIGETYTGLTGKTKDAFGMGEARFVTYINVFNNPITSREGVGVVEIDNRQNEVKYGDIFFTTSSETPEEVGMSSVWLHSSEYVYLNSFCFGFRPTMDLCPYYMAFMLRSPYVRSKIQLLAQGISRYNISKTKLLEIEMPFPLIGEQKIIGSFFANLENQITTQIKKLEQLGRLKTAYLQKMFI